jgi:energy-coupling factor transporter ATP-binding protein EcfA2
MGAFVADSPYAPELFSLMPERHKAIINTVIDNGKFISGEVTVPHENWLNEKGYLYEFDNPKSLKERAKDRYMLTEKTVPNRVKEVLLKDVLARGWKIKVKDKDVEKTEQSFQQKEAAADPKQTILITGHSGSGKSTLGKLLAEKLNLPLQAIDSHPEFKEYTTKDDHGRWQKSLTPGTKEYDFYTDLVNRANKHTIDNSPAAAIIEGSQLGHMSPEELAKYKAHILVGGDLEQSIAQRIARSAKKKGVTFSPEEILEKQIKARAVGKYWEPGIEKFKKLPGVLQFNHTEHDPELLVAQLKEMLNKQAAADHSLKSTNIKAVGYDKKDKTLEVEFHSGGTYKYNNVPKSLFDRIKRVKSPGKFFHNHIRKDDKYEYSKLEKKD